jgi:hypothetical protein
MRPGTLLHRLPPFSIRMVMVCSVVATIGFLALCSVVLLNTREDAAQQSDRAAINLATAIEQDIAQKVEQIDLVLQVVIDGLQRPDKVRAAPSGSVDRSSSAPTNQAASQSVGASRALTAASRAWRSPVCGSPGGGRWPSASVWGRTAR